MFMFLGERVLVFSDKGHHKHVHHFSSCLFSATGVTFIKFALWVLVLSFTKGGGYTKLSLYSYFTLTLENSIISNWVHLYMIW